MVIIGQRLIAYLKADSTLVGYLGSANNVLPMAVSNTRPSAYIVVSTDVGSSGNAVPINRGTVDIEIVVSRTNANAHKTCIDAAKRVDDLLNRAENSVTATGYIVLNFVRESSSGLMVDSEANEYYYTLSYSFIVEH